MVDLNVIEREILDLEKNDTTYATVERLAWLYTVRDHLQKPAGISGNVTGSDFLDACANKPINLVLEVLNEHMQELAVVYPKEYDNIIKKLHTPI